MDYSGIPYKEKAHHFNIPIPAFFLILLVFQLFFMPGLMKQGGKLYVPFKRLVVGGSHNNPPYEFLDENNEPSGYNVELTHALAAEMGLDVEIRLGDRPSIIRAFEQGKVDLLQGITQADPLVRHNLFYPSTHFSQKLFARAPVTQNIASLGQLRRGRVVLNRNTPFLSQLMAKHPYLTFIKVSSHAEALRHLAQGRADYALVVTLPSLYLNRALTFLEEEEGDDRITLVGELAPPMGYGYVTNQKSHALFPQIQGSMASLLATGRQKEVQDRWLGPLNPSEESKRERTIYLGGIIFSPLLFAICTIVFWNRSLTKEVERRTRKIAIQQQQLIQADRMTSLGTLVSGVAHEINNPMGLIIHNLALLQRVYRSAETVLEARYQSEGDFFIGGLPFSTMRGEAQEIFEEMQDGSRRIVQIVNDLKDFSNDKSPALTGRACLNESVTASIRLIETTLNKNGCRVTCHLSHSLPPFKGNRHQIEQVIVNLMLNGCQAHERPGGTLTLRTHTDAQATRIRLDVKDQGVGIKEEAIPFLFDPFFTTKRHKGGTGLGLSISNRIVKDHGGTLQVQSCPGQGTTVTLSLPVFNEETTV